jgi:Co/Zn/Cd efflux system component
MTLRRLIRPTLFLAANATQALKMDCDAAGHRSTLTRSRALGPIVCGFCLCIMCSYMLWESWLRLHHTDMAGASHFGAISFLVLCALGAAISGTGAIWLLYQVSRGKGHHRSNRAT